MKNRRGKLICTGRRVAKDIPENPGKKRVEILFTTANKSSIFQASRKDSFDFIWE
jgi:hypothetical protein